MKKIILSLFAFGALALTNSCSTDPCEGKSATTLCNGKGTLATSGDACGCSCDAGYTGSDCKLEVAGNYTAANDKLSNAGQTAYFPSITIIGSVVTINNFTPYFFGGATKSVTGSISGNKITIPATNGGVSGGATIGGTGTITSSGTIVTITWEGTGTISNVPLTFTGSWVK